MSKWSIKFCDIPSIKKTLEKWFEERTTQQFECISKELALLELYGNKLKLPHSKSLGKGLFELRERHFGYRIYYTFVGDCLIILVAAGDKASQERDISLARKRLSLLKQ